eukprot:GHVP01059603.1.p1 GENE.GHVP01059603.1~~GHVP01059603.1.p1  ORF type:complete len:286 (-),score=28.19 GHVP01059603.1:171-1028(-)
MKNKQKALGHFITMGSDSDLSFFRASSSKRMSSTETDSESDIFSSIGCTGMRRKGKGISQNNNQDEMETERREAYIEKLVKSDPILATLMLDSNSKKYPIDLRVYDISEGRASTWSRRFLGPSREVEGVYHTGLYIHGYEYFYCDGIQKMRPHEVEQNYAMNLVRTHHIGSTLCTRSIFERLLHVISPAFRKQTYDLLKWNCNDFTNICCRKLVGVSIPRYISDQPIEMQRKLYGRFAILSMKFVYGNWKPEDVFGKEIVQKAQEWTTLVKPTATRHIAAMKAMC